VCATSSISVAPQAAPRTLGSTVLVAHSVSGKKVPVALPADWPATVPLPAGKLTATGGRSPHWSVLLVVAQGAVKTQSSAISFYVARGWIKDNSFTVHKGVYRINLTAANRDHSATTSNLTIALTKI
jgi:hypothetical protein